MKTILSFVAVFFLALTMNAQEFKFDNETLDYGTIGKGSDGKRVFEFTNVGDAPLIIKRVQATCGCTVPKKPEQPIMPGQKGEIEVSYDTKRMGRFSKALNVYSNAKRERVTLKIKGVILAEAAPKKEGTMVSE